MREPPGPVRLGQEPAAERQQRDAAQRVPVPLHLVDAARREPGADTPSPRELTVSLTYPASDVRGHRVAPWLPPGAAAQFAVDSGLRPDSIKVPDTHRHDGAPVDRTAGRLPVVIFTPGKNANRSISTVVVEELASAARRTCAVSACSATRWVV